MNLYRLHSSMTRSRQRGAVLMIGMVMMLLVMMIAVSLVRLSMRHTQVVNNEQVRTEATTAANYALDTVINQSYAAGNWSKYSGSTGATVNVNLGISQATDSADGTGAVKVQVSNLTQKRCRKLQNRELMNADGTISDSNKTCIASSGNSPLSIGTSSGGDPSACSNILWEMQAQVDTTNSPEMLNASTPITQGVEQISGTDCT